MRLMKKFFCLLFTLLFAVGTVLATEQDIDAAMNEYCDNIQTSIRNNLYYRGHESAEVLVSFEVNPDGTITNINIDKSGGEAFDKAVTDAIQKVSPYKPFPEGANLSYIRMQSQFKHVVRKIQNVEQRMAIIPVNPTPQEQASIDQYNESINKIVYNKMPTYFGYIPQEAMIELKISSDGSIKSCKLLRTSGVEDYDKKIEDTYSRIKLPAFPSNLQTLKELTFKFVLYRSINSNPMNGIPVFR